jgi:phage terminase small subunit
MPRARDPNRDKAYEIWKASKGKKLLKDIATELGVSDGQIRKWKSQDKWEPTKGNVTNSKRNVTKGEKTKSTTVKEAVEVSEELTEKQRLFCVYYVKTFNATQSAIKAGYSPDTAHVQGSRLLTKVKVAGEIRRIKKDMTTGVFLDAMDVLQKYIKIAFTDITDYLTFGRKEVTVDYDGDGEPITSEVNFVEFKDSSMIDGSVISEVKQGKDGVSIKLEDKMKALEKLSLYFDLFPDKFKRQVEEEKLKIAQAKISKDADDQEKDVAAALRGLVDGINSKAD